jgi:uroporphyrinogen-III synthase
VIVALTQRSGQLEGLDTALEALGHTVIRAPLIRTETILDADLKPLRECAWWLFTSQSAVAALTQLEGWRGAPKTGATGETTAAAIRAVSGLEPMLRSPDGTAQGLAMALLETGERGPFGWVHGDHALPDLRVALEGANLELRGVTVYRTLSLEFPDCAPDAVVLASPSAANALPQPIGDAARIVALGRTTTTAARARGWDVVTATAPTPNAVLDALKSLNPATSRPTSSVVTRPPEWRP